MGKMFLILVDVHTKWIDIHMANTASLLVTINKMHSTFAMLGSPVILDTDNGTAFISAEFEEFCKRNGIRHVTSSLYHPASNGLVEQAVQTFKEEMKKLTNDAVETHLTQFLLKYCLTPPPPLSNRNVACTAFVRKTNQVSIGSAAPRHPVKGIQPPGTAEGKQRLLCQRAHVKGGRSGLCL